MQSKVLKQNMTTGKLLPQMIAFTLPVLFTGILQLLYNAADLAVVGRWADDYALAAVGSTGALINLIVNLFIGLSVGANVLIARYVGEKNEEGISRAVHTSIFISIIFGVFVGIFGIVMAKTLLVWMNSPEEVIDLSSLYVRIYFGGMPFTMLYNFGAAILRGLGDTRRPLIALATSGILNVGLNMILVIGFGRSVDGVAIATVVSQAYACSMVLFFLRKEKGAVHLSFKKLRIHKTELWFMARIGLPAGIQGSLFSISNVLIQSGINSFGPIAVSGNSAAANLEGFVYTSMNAVYQATLTFVGQICGAGRWDRVKNVLFIAFGIVTVVGVVMGGGCFLLGKYLLRFYTDTPETIAYGLVRLRYICLLYVCCGWMEVLVGQMRGMGYSFVPMIVSFIGVCGFRIFWIFTVFRQSHTLPTLYISYPISWAITILIYVVILLVLWNKVIKKKMISPPEKEELSAENA